MLAEGGYGKFKGNYMFRTRNTFHIHNNMNIYISYDEFSLESRKLKISFHFLKFNMLGIQRKSL